MAGVHETESGAATLTKEALTCATGFASSLANPNSQRMADIVDAYSYFGADIWPNEPSKTLREHFATIPKMVVNAGNDEFFLPVSTCTRTKLLSSDCGNVSPPGFCGRVAAQVSGSGFCL